VQWVVAEELRGSELNRVSGDRMMDLLRAALQTFVRAADFPVALPGFLYVLGGPDQRQED
jgi:hypothetical protein